MNKKIKIEQGKTILPKTLVLVFLFLFGNLLKAQNVQLHYDMGKDRKYLTSTVEMFKPDKWGSTFFFIDMDYGSAHNRGVSRAYWELARGVKFWESPFEIHLEYNGGFGQLQTKTYQGTYQINDSWLLGGHYTWHNISSSRIFAFQAMYKFIRGRDEASFQLTGIWTMKFFKDKVTFKGFADFWKDESTVGGYVFLSEPQFWFNFTPNFSLGSEIELSSNYGGLNGFRANPTFAAKWSF